MISTLNIQHLESVNDVVEQITGVKQRETIPDAVVRRADQIELVDMTPEALRRRMAHGNIYPAERIDAALGNYFRPGNLAALRELALLWVADRVDDALAGLPRAPRHRPAVGDARAGRRRAHRARPTASARPPRRAHGARVEGRLVRRPRASAGRPRRRRRRRGSSASAQLVEELGGTYHEVVGADVGEALVAAARTLNATQIVLGATRRSRWRELTRGSVINRVIRDSGVGLDVHVISRADDGARRHDRRGTRRPGRTAAAARARSASRSRRSACRC